MIDKMEFSIVKIFLNGVIILVGAMLINSAAKLLELPSWYDFLSEPKLTLKSFIWLFMIYPFLLGVLVLITNKIV